MRVLLLRRATPEGDTLSHARASTLLTLGQEIDRKRRQPVFSFIVAGGHVLQRVQCLRVTGALEYCPRRMSDGQRRRDMAHPGWNDVMIYYWPWWTSFKALRRHLEKNNQSIELMEPKP